MNSDTILFVTRGSSSKDHWSAVFDKMAIDVIYSSELSLTLSTLDAIESEIVLAEATGNAEADIELIKRLRPALDLPVLIIAENATEEFVISLYNAGADECIYGTISSDLLRAKIFAWLRWQRRPKRMPQNGTVFKEFTPKT